MGPNENALKQVQRDSILTTIRHFRDNIEASEESLSPEETAAALANLDRTRTEMLNALDGVETEAPKAKRTRKAREDATEAEVVDEPAEGGE